MTPTELAIQLEISPKTLRAWLRRQFPRPDSQKWTLWAPLSPHIVRAARQRWE